MASKKRTASNSASGILWVDTDGFAQAVKNVEKIFGKDTVKVYDEAFDKAMALPERIMKDWFENVHYRTGRTKRAYVPGKTVSAWDKDVEGYMYFREYGYAKNKSCVPVFFEYGSPRSPPYHIQPEFVIYYAVADFKDTIHQDIRKVIVDKLKEYGAQVPKSIAYEGDYEGDYR